MDIPKRTLGRTGEEVTMLGLGGEGVLRSHGYDREAYNLINLALDLGINYCESARAYDGSEGYYGKALEERRDGIFLTSKSHARDKAGALDHLHQSLRNMRTDHLDLWQLHDLRSLAEVEEIFGPGGAMEAFLQAREQGKVRFIGVTGHNNPAVIKDCLQRFDFDTVLMPVNPAEPAHRSFLEEVLPLAVEKGLGIVGMKVYLRGLVTRIAERGELEQFFRFALSQPVSTVVIGCDDLEQLEQNVRFAADFQPLSREQQQALVESVAPLARQLMYYKL